MADARVIALFGPTGVGKTEIAVALARRLRGRGEDPAAVSADALQVYRGLEVLTGVASPAQQAELEHRLVSFLPVDETFSAGRYAQLAHAEVDGLLAAGRRPIVVGGTGLYLRAALTELSLRPPPPAGVRERWTAELQARGPQALHELLAQRDPAAAAAIAPGDRRRVVRALELHDVEMSAPGSDAAGLSPDDGSPDTGPARPWRDADGAESELWTASTRRPTLLVGLMMEREALYGRINARVRAMTAAGAADEARRAATAGASVTARKALGFRELLDGDVEAMQRRTRQYARRQLTWMRKLGGVVIIDVGGRDPDDVAAQIQVLDDDADARTDRTGAGDRDEGRPPT